MAKIPLPKRIIRWIRSIAFLRFMLLLLVSAIAVIALVYPFSFRNNSYMVQVGDVASQDILAPRNITYQSEILTQQAKQDAGDAVQPIYLPANTSIARQQLEKLKIDMNYITSVRQDTYAVFDQQVSDIASIADLALDEQIIGEILRLDDNSWQAVQDESLRVLEQIMRITIREDRLRDAQRNVPAYVSFSLNDTESTIVVSLVTPFIVPNSLYSDELTQEARSQASASVDPISITYLEGETIVNRGQVITPIIREALQAFNIVQPQNQMRLVIGANILVLLSIAVVSYTFRRFNLNENVDLRGLIMIGVLFAVFLAGVRLIDPAQEIFLYLYPLSAFGLTVAFLYNRNLAIALSPILAIMAAFSMPNSLNLTLFYIFTSITGILVLGRGRRIAQFFWAGLAMGGAGVAIILAYRMENAFIDWGTLTILCGAAIFNGVASASFTLLLQFLLAQLLGLTTPLRLLDISRPDNPLLQLMLREAPGTYQHSLQVANLAEQAAEMIGADALLVRVGALYHDAGKALNPTYFIENQVYGFKNPHEDLAPALSSKTIVKHIYDGLALARKFRIPPRVQDFMREHHGNMITRYQYAKALQAAGDNPETVDIEKFRYPGPAPRSRETALLMLADGIEARVRANMPKNDGELRAEIQKTIDYLKAEGQLDNSNLTFHDLTVITESFMKTLKNTHHLRIQYPVIEKEKEKENRQAAEEEGTKRAGEIQVNTLNTPAEQEK
jgi:putative nucleotidyltransferase with HDIG domain